MSFIGVLLMGRFATRDNRVAKDFYINLIITLINTIGIKHLISSAPWNFGIRASIPKFSFATSTLPRE
jgi:hypothetical protein